MNKPVSRPSNTVGGAARQCHEPAGHQTAWATLNPAQRRELLESKNFGQNSVAAGGKETISHCSTSAAGMIDILAQCALRLEGSPTRSPTGAERRANGASAPVGLRVALKKRSK